MQLHQQASLRSTLWSCVRLLLTKLTNLAQTPSGVPLQEAVNKKTSIEDRFYETFYWKSPAPGGFVRLASGYIRFPKPFHLHGLKPNDSKGIDKLIAYFPRSSADRLNSLSHPVLTLSARLVFDRAILLPSVIFSGWINHLS